MADSLAKIISDIKADVGRVANRIARGVAQIAVGDLREAHSSIMDSYYAGYTPVTVYNWRWQDPADGAIYYGKSHGYRRTGNLRKSINPQEIQKVGDHGFKATVRVDSSNMSDYVNVTGHTFPAEGVLSLMWDQAIRGLPDSYRGHVGNFSINASAFGIGMAGDPDNAMQDFIDQWGTTRGGEVADWVALSV